MYKKKKIEVDVICHLLGQSEDEKPALGWFCRKLWKEQQHPLVNKHHYYTEIIQVADGCLQVFIKYEQKTQQELQLNTFFEIKF